MCVCVCDLGRVSYRIFSWGGGGEDCMGVVGGGIFLSFLGGSGGIPPQETLKTRCSEMDSGGFLAASRL